MSAFTGAQYRGAMRDHRRAKREEAEARNATTPEGRRRQTRLKAEALEPSTTSRRRVRQRRKSA